MARRWLLVAALALLGGACDPDTVVHKVGWFATMRHQRNIKPYARPIPPVAGAVPVSGAELPLTRETADRLANPRTRTAESLNRGQWVYSTYCQVCHGEHGRGDGPVSLAGEPFTKWANAVYNPTWADWGIMAGSFGWFFMWFLLFVKNFPAVSISEVKEVLPPPRSKPSKVHV